MLVFKGSLVSIVFTTLLILSVAQGRHVGLESNTRDEMGIKRALRGGPNQVQISINRLVPTGPNPAESPDAPPRSASIDYAKLSRTKPSSHVGTNRLVPTGPNPVEFPDAPSRSASVDYAKVFRTNPSSHVGTNRLVPTGPNPAESPDAPPRSASIDYTKIYGSKPSLRVGITRLVPMGPNPAESPDPNSPPHPALL